MTVDLIDAISIVMAIVNISIVILTDSEKALRFLAVTGWILFLIVYILWNLG